MPCRIQATSMINAMAIISALHLFSEGVFPAAEGTGEPYGINRQVVEGAARAGTAMGGPTPAPRQLDAIPAPALNQVVTGDNPQPGEVVDKEITAEINITVEDRGQGAPVGERGGSEDLRAPGDEATLPACNNGAGLVRYERMPETGVERTSINEDVIRRNDTPVEVLTLCVGRCLQDENVQKLKSRCTAFDYLPGKRINYYNSNEMVYTETKCLLTRPENDHLGFRYRARKESVHFREVCYTGSVVRAECPTRLYVMERLINKRFLPKDAELVHAADIMECQDKCLNQYADKNTKRTCRSGAFDKEKKQCFHSSYTIRTHPHLLEDNLNFDYFENTCLTKDRRCPKNKLTFLKSLNTELGGAHDTEVHKGVDLDECKKKCIDSVSIFCRSIEYNTASKTCVISDEDSISKPHELRASTSDHNEYYQVFCIDGEKVKGDYMFENSATQPLNQRYENDVRTAFQLYRDSRLDLDSGFRGYREMPQRLTLAECLDECLEERSFTCRSVMHSEYSQICRLSEYDKLNGRLVPDREFNYFENLMENLLVNQRTSGSSDSSVAVVGSRTGVTSNDQPAGVAVAGGVDGAGPGSAGQTGDNRPGIGIRFPGGRGSGNTDSGFNRVGPSFGGSGFEGSRGSIGTDRSESSRGGSDRFGSSRGESDRFGNSRGGNDRFESNRGESDSSRFGNSRGNINSDRFANSGGGSASSRGSSDNERFRPRNPSWPVTTPLQDRPGIFHPISTDVTNGLAGGRGTLNRGFSTGRQTGVRTGFAGGLGGSDPKSNMGVTQQCTEDGMEFMLQTEEGFRGRIYTYGYYDRCYTRGSGSTATVLKISGARGVPDCGTTKYGETTTNIVVVQFADNVQTSLDKRYNLTCTVVGPGEAVVTSGYIGAGLVNLDHLSQLGSGAPTPIEYLPAESQLQSKVRLQILYGGRPTTTIAVGDPLTFKLDSQRGYNLVSDIFATNVVAKDPYSGRTVELIDSRGCPLDNYVFPALGKGRDGDGLEARFNAFKIPEANFLIFEANVRTCRGGCQAARCTLGKGREQIESYGRKRRDAGDDLETQTNAQDEDENKEEEEEEQVIGLYEVYLSRDEIEDPAISQSLMTEVCLAPTEYYSMVAGLVITIVCLLVSLLCVAFCFRKHRQLDDKNAAADAGNPYHQQHPQQQHKSKFSFPGAHPRTLTQPASYFPSSDPPASAPQAEDGAATSSRFPDPSEPIYTDPALFERSRTRLSGQRRYADGEE
ncbi:uncharacterized protein LOC121855510 isoform X2 [Homarus americanus]|uniref:uncharacterized protein LOC121855510 isoform X2 n=1 Tax=Homarus americanus TaxID=6706 RepID=UPI001C4626A8|nr:uncharacterized protein LOC121855510 isoform X2 [Homarus americanus]